MVAVIGERNRKNATKKARAPGYRSGHTGAGPTSTRPALPAGCLDCRATIADALATRGGAPTACIGFVMNPAEVGLQQVYAAWVSAGAAIVQAIGAVAAIVVSIQLARSSARREREADAAATRRLEAADLAQRERDAAADRAVEARIERGKVEAHNTLIDRVTSLGLLAADQCRSEVDDARAKLTGSGDNIIGGAFKSARVQELHEALPQIKHATTDVELLEALSALQDQILPEKFNVIGGVNYVAAVEAKLQRIYSALEAIEALRRKHTV